MGEQRGENKSAGSACVLCDGPAILGARRDPGGSIFSTILTDCSACGRWGISPQDLETLTKQTAETRRRIAEQVRKDAEAEPGRIPIVTGKMIHYFADQH